MFYDLTVCRNFKSAHHLLHKWSEGTHHCHVGPLPSFVNVSRNMLLGCLPKLHHHSFKSGYYSPVSVVYYSYLRLPNKRYASLPEWLIHRWWKKINANILSYHFMGVKFLKMHYVSYYILWTKEYACSWIWMY